MCGFCDQSFFRADAVLELRDHGIGATGFLIGAPREEQKNNRDDGGNGEKRGNANFQSAAKGEGVAGHFFRYRKGLKRGVRDFLALFGDAGFQLQFFEGMLVAQLHAHSGKQFGGLPGRSHHIIGAQIQSSRTHSTAATRKENHARVGCGSQAFDFRERAATEDIGQVCRKQKHIDRAGLDDAEAFFLRRRGGNFVTCGAEHFLELLAECFVRLDDQYVWAFGRQV